MMPADEPFAVTRVIGTAHDLVQMLRGYGQPAVTPSAVVDGKSLKDALLGLRSVIDEFLAGKL